jgi:hypothetical protein
MSDIARTTKALEKAMEKIRGLETNEKNNSEIHSQIMQTLYGNERLIPSPVFGELISLLHRVKPPIQYKG